MKLETALCAIALTASCAAAADAPAAAPDLKLTALADEAGRLPNSLFSGADAARIAALSPEGFSVSSHMFYLVSDGAGRRCLIDAGLGVKMRSELERAGVAPGDIGAVLLTHSHGDHTGGLLAADGASPVFTNAMLHITEAELAFWRKSRPESAAACEKAYKVSLITADEKTQVFMPGIVALSAPGHTPGHVGFLIGAAGAERRVFVAGDLLHSARIQMALPEVCASFDVDKPLAVATRRALLSRAAREGWAFTASHLPDTAVPAPLPRAP